MLRPAAIPISLQSRIETGAPQKDVASELSETTMDAEAEDDSDVESFGDLRIEWVRATSEAVDRRADFKRWIKSLELS